MRFALTPLVLVVCAIARADSLAELQAALNRLHGDAPVKANIEYAVFRENGDATATTRKLSPVSALVETGPDGLRITWLPAQLAAVAKDSPATTEDERRARKQAMDALTVSTLTEYLNGAPLVLEALEHATLVEEKSVTWRERPARELRLKLDPPMDERTRKYVKSLEVTATIWLAEDGLPLAAERHVHIKGRAMLVFGFESTEREAYEFLCRDDHLVITKHTKEASGSGGGESHRSEITATVTLADG